MSDENHATGVPVSLDLQPHEVSALLRLVTTDDDGQRELGRFGSDLLPLLNHLRGVLGDGREDEFELGQDATWKLADSIRAFTALMDMLFVVRGQLSEDFREQMLEAGWDPDNEDEQAVRMTTTGVELHELLPLVTPFTQLLDEIEETWEDAQGRLMANPVINPFAAAPTEEDSDD